MPIKGLYKNGACGHAACNNADGEEAGTLGEGGPVRHGPTCAEEAGTLSKAGEPLRHCPGLGARLGRHVQFHVHLFSLVQNEGWREGSYSPHLPCDVATCFVFSLRPSALSRSFQCPYFLACGDLHLALLLFFTLCLLRCLSLSSAFRFALA